MVLTTLLDIMCLEHTCSTPVLHLCIHLCKGHRDCMLIALLWEMSGSCPGGSPLWKFLDFVVTVRMPLFVLLKPFIQFKVSVRLLIS